MADLKTTYMGLSLKNPVVVAASGLVSKVEGVKEAEAAGAGAVVLKSLFEEQVRMENAGDMSDMDGWQHPEAAAFLQAEAWMRYGPRDYCKFIEDSKKQGGPRLLNREPDLAVRLIREEFNKDFD